MYSGTSLEECLDTTVNGLIMTGNIFSDFGKAAFIIDPDNEGNSFSRSIVTVTENADLTTPIAITISSNSLINIRYATFINIQATRGSFVIDNNNCQNTICGWTNDHAIIGVPMYVDKEAALNFVRVVLSPSNTPKTITIRSNTF